MDQSILVVPGFVFAQPEHGPSRTKSWLEVNYVLKRSDRLRISRITKEDEADVPPTILPSGPQLQRILIAPNCRICVPGVAGRRVQRPRASSQRTGTALGPGQINAPPPGRY